jgi:hypothetical protein
VNAIHLLRRALAVAVVALLAAAVYAEQPDRADEDMLPEGSQWKGTLTQRAKTPDNAFYPPELKAVLTVTNRDGDAFEAELQESNESLDITFLVRGKIVRGIDKTYTITFMNYDVKGVPRAGVYFLNVPYTAKLTDAGLKGTWTYEEKDTGLALEGDFTLKRADE